MKLLIVLFLISCETMGQDPSAQHPLPTSTINQVVEAPAIEEIEQAYKEDSYSWIASLFSGTDNSLRYRDLYSDHWTWQYVGFAFLKTKDYSRATAAFRRVMEIKPKFSPAIYNLACVAALSDQQDQALELMQLLATRVREYQSLKSKYRQMIQNDEDFAELRSHPRFATTLKLFE